MDEVYDYDQDEGSAKGALITVAIIVVILLIVGFSVGYYVTHRSASIDENFLPDPTQNNGMILAKTGGEVSLVYPIGKMIKVIVPAFALKEDTKISISWVSKGDVTDMYHLQPDGLTFLKPVTVVIPYKESGFKKDETTADIQLEYWLKKDYGSRLLKFSVDSQAKTLNAEVTSF